MCLYFANGKRAIQTDLRGIKASQLMNQTCLATLIRLLQFSKNCCKKQRGVLLFETKSVHVARFTGHSLRSWRYCVGARLKFWRRSRVPKKDQKKGVGTRLLKYRLPENPGILNSPHTSVRGNGLVEGHTYVNHVR